MTRKVLPDWQQFILNYGWRAQAYELAAVLGQDINEVLHVRSAGACKKLKKGKTFGELFTLWHGRAPEDADWPAPRKMGPHDTYEWQIPEIVLLSSLVGTMGLPEMAKILTVRLRKLTRDRKADRTKHSVQARINKIGMQVRDVIGGITTAEAGREIGSLAIINQAIHKKQLSAVRRGRIWVINRESWEEWKAKRVFPPKGYVLLTSIKGRLSIKSDKLSEFARMGYIPTAQRCNPYGTKGPSTQFGTWYLDKKVAGQMVADRRAGRPMPWHGKPMLDNLRATYKTWIKYKHPTSCKTCADIWGKKAAPETFDDYVVRYPQLEHGAKRHLTRKWNPGMTVQQLAAHVARTVPHVRRAIDNGMLETTLEGKKQYISLTDATRWKARKCPTGDSEKSWLALETACKQYLFTMRELRSYIRFGKLKSKVGTDGPQRGVEYVSRHQCGKLRQAIGFTEEQAARRAGVTVPRLRVLLEGLAWRKADGIPLTTVQAVIKRLESREGYTIEEAAEKVGESVQWVLECKRLGIIKVSQAKWDRRRTYISEPMLKRLQVHKKNPVRPERLGADWLRLSDAAHEAGVTAATIIKWASAKEMERRKSKNGWRYHREAARARARIYWQTVRFHRAVPPDWLKPEHRTTRNNWRRTASPRGTAPNSIESKGHTTCKTQN